MQTEEPAIKIAADVASGVAQRMFLRLNQVQLALLSCTALISGWVPTSAIGQRAVAVITAILMVGSLCISAVLQANRYDDHWFKCRAIAENVKSAMWTFIMAPASKRHEAEAAYRDQVKLIKQRFDDLAKYIVAGGVAGKELTDYMTATQQLTGSEKLATYRDHRITDQMSWYGSKAKWNLSRESRWQWLILAFAFMAITMAIVQALTLWQFNVVGGLAALNASFIAWTQTKRHSDLSNSYAVAEEDLREIAERSPTSDEEIEQFVLDVESAISREHRVWLNRRVI